MDTAVHRAGPGHHVRDFAAYATIVVPDGDEERPAHTRLTLRLLSEQSGDQPWWLGYLDTGTDDVVFPDAPR